METNNAPTLAEEIKAVQDQMSHVSDLLIESNPVAAARFILAEQLVRVLFDNVGYGHLQRLIALSCPADPGPEGDVDGMVFFPVVNHSVDASGFRTHVAHYLWKNPNNPKPRTREELHRVVRDSLRDLGMRAPTSLYYDEDQWFEAVSLCDKAFPEWSHRQIRSKPRSTN